MTGHGQYELVHDAENEMYLVAWRGHNAPASVMLPIVVGDLATAEWLLVLMACSDEDGIEGGRIAGNLLAED